MLPREDKKSKDLLIIILGNQGRSLTPRGVVDGGNRSQWCEQHLSVLPYNLLTDAPKQLLTNPPSDLFAVDSVTEELYMLV